MFKTREPSLGVIRNGNKKPRSAPVVITEMKWVGSSRHVFCSDGHTRVCHFNNFTTIEEKEQLNQKLIKYAIQGDEVVFYAKGNNDANHWFYRVVKADEVPQEEEESFEWYELPPCVRNPLGE